MIDRYSTPAMQAIWSEDNKFKIMLEVEILAAEAMELMGTIPKGVAQAVREKGSYDPARITEIEAEVKHDVIAFLTNVSENVGEESKWLHYGLTSSDILDTALGVRMNEACDLVMLSLDKLVDKLVDKSEKLNNLKCLGRTHGMAAEETTMGRKFAGHAQAMKRSKIRLQAAQQECAVGALSGAVGAYNTLDPKVESYVMEKLGLAVEPVSTQVIPRDRHAYLIATLALIGASIENLATEIRHLQRSEVGEVSEGFSKAQKGSSAMPHKKNPILSENLTGLARMLRSYIMPAMENVTLWHERDISHSSVERMIIPDAFMLADFCLTRMANVIENLVIHEDRVAANLAAAGKKIQSQRRLMDLIQSGMSRDEAYRKVQSELI